MDSFTDEQFLHAFLTYPPTQFHHRDHLRVAWSLARQHDLEEALRLASSIFQAFAQRAGRPERYDAALTERWVRRVAQGIEQHPGISDFETFLAACPQLLDREGHP